MGKDYGPVGLPPTWLIPNFTALFFYFDPIGTPWLEYVDQSMCRLCRYSYIFQDSCAAWEGIWQSANGAGHFYFFQKSVGGDQDCIFQAGLTFGVTNICAVDNNHVPTSGIWSGAFPEQFNCGQNPKFDFPWVSFSFFGVTSATYAQIRGASHNPDDTKPQPWNDVYI